MSNHLPRKPHITSVQEPEESEELLRAIDLEEGLVPTMIADDPEYERVVEPED